MSLPPEVGFLFMLIRYHDKAVEVTTFFGTTRLKDINAVDLLSAQLKRHRCMCEQDLFDRLTAVIDLLASAKDQLVKAHESEFFKQEAI